MTYYSDNKAIKLNYQNEYYKTNKEIRLKYQNDYNKRNRQKILEYHKTYYYMKRYNCNPPNIIKDETPVKSFKVTFDL